MYIIAMHAVPKNGTVNWKIFMHDSIHKLINQFSWVPGTHENIVAQRFVTVNDQYSNYLCYLSTGTT